jgi:hypothetical protein
LNAIVLAVADEEPSARIDRERVNHVEPPGPIPFLPQVFKNFPALSNFKTRASADRGAATGMAITNENVAIGRDGDFGGASN